MRNDFDYSFHYSFWHDNSLDHFNAMVAQGRHLLGRHGLGPRFPNERALDIGAGVGFLVQSLTDVGYDAVGLERSEDQVAISRLSADRLVLTDDELGFLAENSNAFGLITLIDVLEHVPRHQQIGLIQHCHAALQPGGRLVIQTTNAASPLASAWHYLDWTHEVPFTYFSLRFVLLNGGFAEDSIDFRDPESGIGRAWRPRLWLRSCLRAISRLRMYAEFGRSAEAKVRLDLNHFVVAHKR